ncbi:MAG: hypothetical protein EOO88_45730 [Pedobacter sp.]|nr:MAG: hypothetical protein EOO88_45730 [Pedobacter sp.]
MVGEKNLATISISNGASLSTQLTNPGNAVNITSLRRNVGLTQGVSAQEIAANDPNIRKFPQALVYLDGSVLRGLKFGEGKLKTAPSLEANGPGQTVTSWEVLGYSDALKPPDKVDNKFIVDFEKIDGTNPLTKPRDPSTGNYTTNFKTENVIITMGASKTEHKVERLPASKKAK